MKGKKKKKKKIVGGTPRSRWPGVYPFYFDRCCFYRPSISES